MAPSISGKCLAISLTILVHQIHVIALIPDDMLVTYPNDATMKFTRVPGSGQPGAIRLKGLCHRHPFRRRQGPRSVKEG
jgi:hypothetical protein